MNVVRKYIRYCIPMVFSVFTVRQALPFFSDGPLYLISLKVVFWNQCEGGGLWNMSLLSNLMFWDLVLDKNKCWPYMQYEGLQYYTGKDRSSIEGLSKCEGLCVVTMGTFANLF